ncbi:MAG: PrsW family glutamic-type intramembrane protease [Ruthenibacterium sp.]
MTYIENILICLTAPLLVGALFAGTRYRRSLLLISVGYAVCLLAAYINSFFAGLYGADMVTAAVEIAPVVEEVIKLLPLLFYLLIFEPEQKDVRMAIITIGASFATFENVCYLTENGASQLSYILIRGFGTGSMHIICGVIVGYGLLYVHLQSAGGRGRYPANNRVLLSDCNGGHCAYRGKNLTKKVHLTEKRIESCLFGQLLLFYKNIL